MQTNQKLTTALHDFVANKRKTDGASFLPEGAASLTVSLESLGDDLSAQSQTEELNKDLHERVRNVLAENDIEIDGDIDTQITAFVETLKATENPSAYHARATAEAPVASADTPVIDVAVDSQIDARDEFAVSQEAFDERGLDTYLDYSPVFNMQAARQDAFGEMFFKTIVTTPDNIGFRVTARRTMVHNDYQHLGNGRPAPRGFLSRSLIDASKDYRILLNEATRIYPQYDDASPYFSDVVNPEMVTLGNAKFRTAPLKLGQEINLLSISQNATLDPGGINDVTDTVDTHAALDNVYLQVTNAGGTESIVKMPVRNLPLSQFQKAPEGLSRDVQLMFRTNDIPLTGDTDSIDGTDAAALQYLRDDGRKDWVVRLNMVITGLINVETGNMSLQPATVSIASVWQPNPQNPSELIEVTEEADIQALRAELSTITVDSVDVYARRSNLNRRERGLLVRTEEQSEIYKIPLGSPITALKPVTDTPTGVDLAAPIEATRKKNSNDAVTKLFEYSKTLSVYRGSLDRRLPVDTVEGIGRLFVRPYYERINFAIDEVVDSVRSHEREADISAAFVNLIRDSMTKCANISGYAAALEQTGGSDKPHIAIGTEGRIWRYLMVSGDSRTMSDAYNYSIQASHDDRMTNTIFATFIRPNATGADPLNFGNMVWIPELITDLQNSRGGAMATEFMVQPRVRHIVHLPVLIHIEVTGLDKLTKERQGVKVVNFNGEEDTAADDAADTGSTGP